MKTWVYCINQFSRTETGGTLLESQIGDRNFIEKPYNNEETIRWKFALLS